MSSRSRSFMLSAAISLENRARSEFNTAAEDKVFTPPWRPKS